MSRALPGARHLTACHGSLPPRQVRKQLRRSLASTRPRGREGGGLPPPQPSLRLTCCCSGRRPSGARAGSADKPAGSPRQQPLGESSQHLPRLHSALADTGLDRVCGPKNLQCSDHTACCFRNTWVARPGLAARHTGLPKSSPRAPRAPRPADCLSQTHCLQEAVPAWSSGFRVSPG